MRISLLLGVRYSSPPLDHGTSGLLRRYPYLQWGLILKGETDPIIYWYRVRIEKQDDIKENLSGRMLPVQAV